MPEFKLDQNGQLVDDKGEPVKIGDEVVKVLNAQTKEQTETVITQRLARQADKIKALEAAANKTPELEALLEELKKEKGALEEQLQSAKAAAQAEVSGQMDKLKKQNDEMKAALDSEKLGRMRDQLTSAILAKAGDAFISPADDIVPRLLASHKREPALGPDKKPVDGQVLDLFKVEYKGENDADISEFVPLEKALQVYAAKPEFAHYVKPTNRGGSGGGSYNNLGNFKRGTMTTAEKAKFVGDHGEAAYKQLPA